MSNGYFSIQGYQVQGAGGSRNNLGPFNVPFGPVGEVLTEVITPGTVTIPVPAFTKGVAIVPPIGAPPAGVTLKLKTNIGDSGDFISTQMPSLLEWDTANSHVPTNVYLVVAGGNITVGVMFL